MHQAWTIAVVLLVLGLLAPGGVTAQDGTPPVDGSRLAAMGYPELMVRVIDDAYELPVTEVPAGRTLIRLENAGQESWHGFLLRLPEGVTFEAIQAATPAPGEEDAPPPWLLDAHFPGFPGETLPGQTNVAVVDLTPGEYLIVSDSFQPFVVSGDGATPVAAQPPAADGTVRLFEYGFEFPDAVAPGPHVWEIVNAGREPHELLLARSSVPVTPEQVLDLFAGEEESATPPGGGPSMADIEPVGGMGWLSPGQIAWTDLDLVPGTYVALCFVFDPATGMPHIMLGMIDVFTVGEAGSSAAATPAA